MARADDDDAGGVPLAHYVADHPDTGVRFTCTGCMAHHDVPMDRVLERLAKLGRGPETGVRAVGRLGRRPCPRCGAVRWETTPAFRVFPASP